MRLDDELEFVLRECLRAVGLGDDLQQLPPRRDWTTVFGYAGRLRVLPLLGWRLANQQVSDVPYWFRVGCTSAHRDTVAMSRLLSRCVGEITLRATELGLDPLPVARKGLHVADFYPSPGCRPTTDIDLLVAQDTVEELLEIVTSLGWEAEAIPRRERQFLMLATHVLPPLTRNDEASGVAISLEIATSLGLPAMSSVGRPSVSPREMIGRAKWSAYGFRVLDKVSLMIDLCLNLYVNCVTLRYVRLARYQRLTHYLDVLIVGSAMDAQEWSTFETMVAGTSAEGPARYAVSCCRALFGSQVMPQCIPESIERPEDIDEVGQLELETPYRWPIPLRHRLTSDSLPAAMPVWS